MPDTDPTTQIAVLRTEIGHLREEIADLHREFSQSLAFLQRIAEGQESRIRALEKAQAAFAQYCQNHEREHNRERGIVGILIAIGSAIAAGIGWWFK